MGIWKSIANSIATAAVAPPVRQKTPDHSGDQITFGIGVIVLAAKLAKADGVVSRTEIESFKQVFKIQDGELEGISQLFNQASADPLDFEDYARQIAQFFNDRPPILEELLEALFCIAEADGFVHPTEMGYLRSVAQIFKLSESDFERIRSGHPTARGVSEINPYHVLGVDPRAEMSVIKTTYHRLIHQNHPDKLIAQGLPEEFIDLANDKMAAINAAYDRIQHERKIQERYYS